MSRRLASILLPVLAVGASVAAAGTLPAAADVAVLPPQELGAVGLTDAAPSPAALDRLAPAATTGFPMVADTADTPASDLGLAGAALANGPVATPSPGRQAIATAAKPKARLPEPATWVMLIGGMYGIGAVLRRRHRASEAAFTARIRAIAANEDEQGEA